MIPLLLVAAVLVGGRWSERIGCRPTEFRCSSGQCVDGGRFCDGNPDCFDASDEPDRCTNCNRTFFGEVDVKYPLRLSERRSPTCTLSFVAAGGGGGKYGDRVEITFLSFQIGTFDFDSSTCLRGYMGMEESTAEKRHRRRTKNKKKKGPPRGSSLLQAPSSFCGPLVGPSATFYSRGDSVRLTVVVPPAAGQPLVPRLYLTYRFLKGRGEEDGGCDRVLTDCDRTDCVIRSPNYPGFYLRNISCHYWIREVESTAQIEIFQDNEFKIRIPSGRTNNDKPGGGGALTTDCAGDALRVHDGRSADAPLLASFCGAGPLPPVRSSGPHLLLRLTSVPFQPLATARFEIAVRVVSGRRHREAGCSVAVDGARHPAGVLRSPDHSVPAGTVCSYRVTGKRPTDRVWLYFASFHVPDANPWSEEERCDAARMEVVFRSHARHRRHQWADAFCEKRSPRQCGHASDFPDLVPERPCALPAESYLSPGPELELKMTYSAPTALRGGPHFLARYEVVESLDPCSFVVDSTRDGPQGVIESPKNVFLYGRGGARDLHCKYELRGTGEERVRITLRDVRFPPSLCRTAFHPVTQKPTCQVLRLEQFAVVNVTELWHGTRVFVGCACDDHHPVAVMESVGGGSVVAEFVVRGMGPRDDFRTFRFRLEYEFVAKEGACAGAAVRSGSKGGVLLRGVGGPVRCRWMLAAFPARALYVTVNGRTFDDECRNKILFFGINDWEPYAVYCPSDDGHREFFFTQGWRPNHPFEPDLTLLEFLVNEEEGPSAPLAVSWVEVTRSAPCPLECPELEACIGEELACDGVPHCPLSASDEAPERCSSHAPFLAAIVAVSCAVAAAILAALVAVVKYRLRTAAAEDKSPVPPACQRKKVPVVR